MSRYSCLRLIVVGVFFLPFFFVHRIPLWKTESSQMVARTHTKNKRKSLMAHGFKCQIKSNGRCVCFLTRVYRYFSFFGIAFLLIASLLLSWRVAFLLNIFYPKQNNKNQTTHVRLLSKSNHLCCIRVRHKRQQFGRRRSILDFFVDAKIKEKTRKSNFPMFNIHSLGMIFELTWLRVLRMFETLGAKSSKNKNNRTMSKQGNIVKWKFSMHSTMTAAPGKGIKMTCIKAAREKLYNHIMPNNWREKRSLGNRWLRFSSFPNRWQ